MQILKDKIIKEGKVLPGNVLKVDSFLNHQLDMALFSAMGRQLAALFSNAGVTKILTVEASGIGLACMVSQYLGCVPVVFGNYHISLNRDASVYSTPIFSFTHITEYEVTIARRFLSEKDKALIVDDFLANGEAVHGLMDILSQAGASLAGIGIAVEKGFQRGGELIRAQGVRVESLAVVDAMDADTGEIIFRH